MQDTQKRYKNLLQNFHPLLKTQILPTAKAFLKNSHDSASALKSHINALQKLQKVISDETVANEFGLVVGLVEKTHGDQMEFLKRFYVDFVLPLEANLERDVGVVKAHQREYLKNKNKTDACCLDDVKCLEARRLAWIGGALGAVFKEQHPVEIIPPQKRYKALYPHCPTEEGQLLAFEAGDILESSSDFSGWMFGVNTKSLKSGWFPGGFVVAEEPEVDYEEEEEEDIIIDDGSSVGSLDFSFGKKTIGFIKRRLSFGGWTLRDSNKGR